MAIVPVQDSLAVLGELLAEPVHGLEPHTSGILYPVVQPLVCLTHTNATLPHLLNLLFEDEYLG
jgi:hypothetical protein